MKFSALVTPITEWFTHIRYEIKCRIRPWNRIHVKSMSIYYRDPDELYLHACFQILVNFVEELGKTSEDTGTSSNAQKGLSVLRFQDEKDSTALADLYEWWILRTAYRDLSYLKSNAPRNDMIITDQGIMHLNFTPEQEVGAVIGSSTRVLQFEEDERQLQKLTKLRSRLWI